MGNVILVWCVGGVRFTLFCDTIFEVICSQNVITKFRSSVFPICSIETSKVHF